MKKALNLIFLLIPFFTLTAQWDSDPWDGKRWGGLPYGTYRWGQIAEEGWDYKYAVTVSNTGTDTLFNYQCYIGLNAGNFDFSHVQSNGEDIRIISNYYDTLDYWIASHIEFGPDTGGIWFEADTALPESSNMIGWLLSANSSAQAASDGEATFLLFNDWDAAFVACGWTGITDLDSVLDYGNNPVISSGDAADWDDHIREIGNVLYDADLADSMKYMAFYTGYKGTYQSGADTLCIGMAYSSDAESWTKYANNPVYGTADGDTAAEDPYIVKVNDTTWYMYHEIRHDETFCCVGVAISYDTCKSFTAYEGNPILEPSAGPDWEDQDVSSPVVWFEGSNWYMLYEGRGTGSSGKVGLATSTDGLAWTKDTENNPVLDVGAEDKWDDALVVPHDIEIINGTHYLFYVGSDGSNLRSGMATSTDLVSWTRYSENPLRRPTTDPLMVFQDADGGYRFHYWTGGGVRLGYPYKFDTTGWRAKFPDWTLHQKGSDECRVYTDDGELILAGRPNTASSANILSDFVYTNGIAICMRRRVTDYTDYIYMNTTLGKGNIVDVNGASSVWYETTLDSGYVCWGYKVDDFKLREMPGNIQPGNYYFDPGITEAFAVHEMVYDAGANLKYYINHTLKDSCSDNTLLSSEKNILISQGRNSYLNRGGIGYVDWVFVRKYDYPEPSTTIGSEQEN